MPVVIHGLRAHIVDITDAAAQAVRLSFNPSGDPSVERLKSLAAAFISECDAIAAEMQERSRVSPAGVQADNEFGRAFSVAKAKMQTAASLAADAATTAIPESP